ADERIVLAAIEPRAVSRDARDEDVAAELVAARACSRLDVRGRRALRPVVGDVEHGLGPLPPDRSSQRGVVAAVGLHVPNLGPEVVAIGAVQHGDVVPAGDEAPNDLPADESRAADY